MKQLISLDIEDATIMINAAVKKSKEINVLETICVVDNAVFSSSNSLGSLLDFFLGGL